VECGVACGVVCTRTRRGDGGRRLSPLLAASAEGASGRQQQGDQNGTASRTMGTLEEGRQASCTGGMMRCTSCFRGVSAAAAAGRFRIRLACILSPSPPPSELDDMLAPFGIVNGSCVSHIVCGVAAPVLLPRLSRPATWLCSARPPCRVRHGWCTDAPSTTSPWSSARRTDAAPWSARDRASGAAGADRRSHHREVVIRRLQV